MVLYLVSQITKCNSHQVQQPNSKLKANSSISIGGISFSLGDTDTPAFDLQDATDIQPQI